MNDVLIWSRQSIPHSSSSSTQLTNTPLMPQAPVKTSDITSCHHTEKLEQRTDLQHTHMLSDHQDWIKLGFVLNCNSWIPLALWIWEAERR